jgi:NADP-reducing hydrogenase subunit HndB
MSALKSYQRIRTMAETRIAERGDGNGVSFQLSRCSEAVGAKEVARRIKTAALKYGLWNVRVKVVGCMGLCSHEPILTVKLPGEKAVSYSRVTPNMAEMIISHHVMQGKVIKPWLIQ